MSRVAIGVLAVGIGAVVVAHEVREAEACSGCMPGALVPEDGATVPANIPALAWRPSQGGSPEADPAQLTLTRTDTPGTPLPMTRTQENGLYLLVPASPLEVGVSYTLTDPTACDTFGGPRGMTSTFNVAAAAAMPQTLGTLDVGEHIRIVDDLAVGAACSLRSDIDRVAVDVDFVLASEPWRDALFYQTFVDGQPWTPSGHLLQRPAPGASWRGRGSDWLYAVCDANTPSSELAEGTHQVEIRATMPGSSVTLLSAAVEVTLSCAGPPPPPPTCQTPPCDPVDPPDDGGCSTSPHPAGPSASGALLLLAAFLLLARRPRRRRG